MIRIWLYTSGMRRGEYHNEMQSGLRNNSSYNQIWGLSSIFRGLSANNFKSSLLIGKRWVPKSWTSVHFSSSRTWFSLPCDFHLVNHKLKAFCCLPATNPLEKNASNKCLYYQILWSRNTANNTIWQFGTTFMINFSEIGTKQITWNLSEIRSCF